MNEIQAHLLAIAVARSRATEFICAMGMFFMLGFFVAEKM